MTRARHRLWPVGWAGWRPVLLVLVGSIAILAALAWAWSSLPIADIIHSLQQRVIELGFLGFGVFALAYILITLVLGPAAVLSASAGLVWGPVTGLVSVMISATLAAVVAAVVGRYLGRRHVQKLVAKDRRMQAVIQAVEDSGWRIVVLLRLSPLLPFGIQNYLLSVTGIRLLPYALATAIGILPSSAVYVYLGSLGNSVGSDAGPMRWVLLGVGLLATVLVVMLITRRAQAALARATINSAVATTDLQEATPPQA